MLEPKKLKAEINLQKIEYILNQQFPGDFYKAQHPPQADGRRNDPLGSKEEHEDQADKVEERRRAREELFEAHPPGEDVQHPPQ